MLTNGNDPLAGSPTETLLRLLLPPDDKFGQFYGIHHVNEAVIAPMQKPH